MNGQYPNVIFEKPGEPSEKAQEVSITGHH